MDLQDSKLWKKGMVEEMDSLGRNKTCDLVEFSIGRKYFSSKWAFKKKLNVKGKVEKNKVHLVAKVYS